MTTSEIISKYISFFEKRGHKRIANSPLVPQNDPTTLFTSSGMQPLVPYLLGEEHAMGKRLVNVQNCFRAQDIDEVGDNRHTTFFRMLGNWSLGDYFKKEQIPWIWEFVTKELNIPANKLYVSVFKGYKDIPKDIESEKIWTEILEKEGLNPKERIFLYGVEKNWWSRAGEPNNMPIGEPGGPDSEIFFDFGISHTTVYGSYCHPNCNCGRFMEIVNSVFMEYQRQEDRTFKKLPQRNVDHGAGVERLLAAVENKQDIFQTSLFAPIIQAVEKITGKSYIEFKTQMRIVTDHLISSVFIISQEIMPSNKEQGYILKRLIRRALDNFYKLGGIDLSPILESIVEQYKETDKELETNYEKIKDTVLEEKDAYQQTIVKAKNYILKKYPSTSSGLKSGDEIKGQVTISADDAFFLYTTHGLSPSQIKSLGYAFNQREFAEKMREHQKISRAGATKKFAGGLADHSAKTIMGHTATHLLHQAIRDVVGNHVHQTGSNITAERIRFDFNYDKKITDDEIKKIEEKVNGKIKENLKVHSEMMPLKKAKEIGAIGLFDEKYSDMVKVYFIGQYSVEFCGGPHVDFTEQLKRLKIIRQENIGKGQRRLYAVVG